MIKSWPLIFIEHVKCKWIPAVYLYKYLVKKSPKDLFVKNVCWTNQKDLFVQYLLWVELMNEVQRWSILRDQLQRNCSAMKPHCVNNGIYFSKKIQRIFHIITFLSTFSVVHDCQCKASRIPIVYNKKIPILSGTSKDVNNFFVNLGNRIKCSQIKNFKGQLWQ